MEWWLTLLCIMGGLLVLMATGLPIAFCFIAVDLIGAIFIWGGVEGLRQLVFSMFTSISQFTLLPVPMFILLGEVLFQSKLGPRVIDIVDKWMGRVPGRLALTSVGAATILSTLSGSSIGTAAMLGSIMLPEMKRHHYSMELSIGACMSGGLAMIIPPSAFAVMLASLAQVSVGKLLIAGVIPGILLAVLYASYIVVRCIVQPSVAPKYVPVRMAFSERIVETARYLLPLGIIVFCVIGLILLGIADPTEAAAMGALASFVLAAAYGQLNWSLIKKSTSETLKVTIMFLMILAGSTAFAQILAYTGATSELVRLTVSFNLAPIIMVLLMQLVVIILGCFMEGVSILMITLPIFMPIVRALGIDGVWFTLLLLINIEVGLKTPPFGFILFVMRGVAPFGTTTGTIYRSVIPFVLCDIAGMGLILVFPAIAVWLPNLIRG